MIVEISFFQIVTTPHVSHLIRASRGSKDGSLSMQVSTLPSLVSMDLL